MNVCNLRREYAIVGVCYLRLKYEAKVIELIVAIVDAKDVFNRLLYFLHTIVCEIVFRKNMNVWFFM